KYLGPRNPEGEESFLAALVVSALSDLLEDWPMVVPARPVMNHALAAGSLVVRAELARLLRRRKRPNQGPIEDPLAAQIRAANDRLQTAKLVREFCLQAAE